MNLHLASGGSEKSSVDGGTSPSNKEKLNMSDVQMMFFSSFIYLFIYVFTVLDLDDLFEVYFCGAEDGRFAG